MDTAKESTVETDGGETDSSADKPRLKSERLDASFSPKKIDRRGARPYSCPGRNYQLGERVRTSCHGLGSAHSAVRTLKASRVLNVDGNRVYCQIVSP